MKRCYVTYQAVKPFRYQDHLHRDDALANEVQGVPEAQVNSEATYVEGAESK